MTRPLTRVIGATALLTGLLIATATDAGVVETIDGTRLVGTITKVSPGSVVIDTRFAGTVTIARDAVTAMRTETPVTTKLIDGTVVTGTAAIDTDGRWHVVNDTLEMRAAPEKVQAAWQPGATPPPEAGYEQPRSWAYTVGVDVNGREGNAQERGTTVTADATLTGKDDELYLYTSVDKVQQGGTDTADEIIAGFSYKTWYKDPWGWYVRAEVERDVFENVDLRTTLAGRSQPARAE